MNLFGFEKAGCWFVKAASNYWYNRNVEYRTTGKPED